MTSQRRNLALLAKIALAATSVLLVLALAEVAVRVVPLPETNDVVPKRGRMPAEWRDLPKFKNGGMRELREPNARGTAFGALIETNSAGLRGPERTLLKPPGTFRVAVIGDSVTIGWGVLQEETYADLIEGRLNETRDDQSYEVLNVGLSGYNAINVVRRLRHRAMKFDPDLFVYGFTINDIEGEHYVKSSTAGFRDPHRYDRARSHLWRLLGPRIDALHDSLWPPKGSYTHELLYNYFENPAAWADVEEGLDMLSRTAARRDACVVVLIHTQLTSLRFMHPFHPLYDKLQAAAEERGFVVAPSWSRHDGLDERTLWVAAFDHHPNARGHELLADTAMEALADLPAACWQ